MLRSKAGACVTAQFKIHNQQLRTAIKGGRGVGISLIKAQLNITAQGRDPAS